MAVARFSTAASWLSGDLQRAPQMTGLQGRHRHALPEGGVEAGYGITEGDDAGGEAVQLVVTTPSAGRKSVERRVAKGFGLRQRGVEVGRKQLLGQRQHLGECPRRLGVGHPEGGQDPGPVLVTQHAQPERLVVGGPGDHHLLRDQAFRDAELVGGVVDADVHDFFDRALISPLRQPHRQPGTPARCVDDEAGGYELWDLWVAAFGVGGIQQHTGHPLVRAVEPRLGHGAPHDLDVVYVLDSFAQLPLQMRAAGHVSGELVAQGMPRPEDMARGAQINAVRPVLQHGHARGHHVLQQAGKQALELHCAAGHQHVQMLVLRDCRPVRRCARQFVALVDGHPGIGIR